MEFKATAGRSGSGDVLGLLATPPGIELHHPTATGQSAIDSLNEFRRSNIRQMMKKQLQAKNNTKRLHRNSAIGIPFNKINKMMLDSWKVTDEAAKEIFQELAEEGRTVYATRMKKYNDEKKYLTKSGESSIKSSPDKPMPKFKNSNQRTTKEEEDTTTAEVSSVSTEVFELLSYCSDNSELDDWEPLPFQTEKLTFTSTSPRVVHVASTPPAVMSSMTEVKVGKLEPLPPVVTPMCVAKPAAVKGISYDDIPNLPFHPTSHFSGDERL